MKIACFILKQAIKVRARRPDVVNYIFGGMTSGLMKEVWSMGSR